MFKCLRYNIEDFGFRYLTYNIEGLGFKLCTFFIGHYKIQTLYFILNIKFNAKILSLETKSEH